MPSSTRSSPKMNSSSGSSSRATTSEASDGVERREALRVGQPGDLAAPCGHDLLLAGSEIGGERGLVADVAADQQDHGELLRLAQAGVAERAQAVLQPGDLVGRDRRPADRHAQHPRVPPQRVVVSPGPARQPGPPALARRRCGRRRVERGVDHQREQLVLGRYVAVERHRGGAELGRDAAHGQRLEPFGRGHVDGGSDDPLEVEAGLRPLRRAPPQAPHLLDARRQSGLALLRHRGCSLSAYQLRCIAYTERRRSRPRDVGSTGDRSDRPREVLWRGAGAGRGRPVGRARQRVLAARARTARARRRSCGSCPPCCAPMPVGRG